MIQQPKPVSKQTAAFWTSCTREMLLTRNSRGYLCEVGCAAIERPVKMDRLLYLLILLIPHRFFPLHPKRGRGKIVGKNFPNTPVKFSGAGPDLAP